MTSESPVAEPGKIDLGRTIGETEIRNLPLVSRNPYNFAFLQANVTGYENNEFGVPRINANGSQMHTNYQIDGNTNTEKDRAGLRMLPISEVLVREVKVITNGFAPEFGQTTGMVYNAVTPSGPTSFTDPRVTDSSETRCRRSRSSWRRPRANQTPKRTTSRARWAARSQKTSGTTTGLTVHRPESRQRQPGDHRRSRRRPGARDHAAGRRRHSGAPASEFLVWQDGLSTLEGEPAFDPVFRLQESFTCEHWRRPDDHRSRDGLYRSHGLHVRSGRVVDWRVDAERASRPVRAAAPVPDARDLG